MIKTNYIKAMIYSWLLPFVSWCAVRFLASRVLVSLKLSVKWIRILPLPIRHGDFKYSERIPFRSRAVEMWPKESWKVKPTVREYDGV